MSTSKMPARIWAWGGTASGWTPRKFINEIPAREYVRADIVERTTEALRECQSALSSLTAPEAIETTTVATAWANCVAAEAEARSALTSYREASNDKA